VERRIIEPLRFFTLARFRKAESDAIGRAA
jgi:hypothetical protein